LSLGWLSRSECTIVPAGDRNAIAFRNADTASWAVIRSAIEYPTIRFEHTSLTAHK
jgi:hypothetical protein